MNWTNANWQVLSLTTSQTERTGNGSLQVLLQQARQLKRNLIFLALVAFVTPTAVSALDVGFDALLSATASDNVNEDNRGAELDGSLVFGQFNVFGEHRTRLVESGFTGEIEMRRQFDDLDTEDDVVTLTRFYGSAEFAITPRVLSWYFGDVLGGTRRDDAIQSQGDVLENRSNVFITGPGILLGGGSSKTLDTNLLYVNRTDDTDEELSSLYTLQSEYSSLQSGGWRWGLNLGNIYVDNPEESSEEDYNRASVDVFTERTRGLNVLYAGIGATRYDSDDQEPVEGLSADLRWLRKLSDASSFFVNLNRDLVDETITAVQTLSATGDASLPENAGIFHSTTINLGYSYETTPSGFAWNIGVADSDYETAAGADGLTTQNSDLLDQYRYFTGFDVYRSLNERLTLRGQAAYQQEEFRNTDDFSESVLGLGSVVYRFTRSFQFELTYEHEINEGLSSTGQEIENIDSVENRVTIGLRYVPPSRASRDLTVELKSLVY